MRVQALIDRLAAFNPAAELVVIDEDREDLEMGIALIQGDREQVRIVVYEKEE